MVGAKYMYLQVIDKEVYIMRIATSRINRKIIFLAMFVIVVAISSIPRDALDQVVENQDSNFAEQNEEFPRNSDGGIQLDWSFNEGNCYSSAVIGDIDADGTIEVVVGSDDYNIYALNGENGTIQWSYTTGEMVYSSPALGDIDGDGTIEIVIGSHDGTLRVLNGENGTIQWSKTLPDSVFSTPALGDIDRDGTIEVVYTGFYGEVIALNGENGTVQWEIDTPGNNPSSPSLGDIDGDGTMEVIVASGHIIYTLNGENGSLQWDYYRGGGSTSPSPPSLGDIDGDGTLEILVVANDAEIHALNGEDGSLQWGYRPGGQIYGVTPALGDIDGDGTMEVVTGSLDYNVYVLNGEDGSLQWESATGDWIYSSPALADTDGDGTIEVIIGSDDDNIYAFNGENGTVQWTYAADHNVRGSPVIGNIDADDNLEILVGSYYSTFYALEPTDIVGQQRVEWQGFHGDLNFTNTRNHRYIDPDRDFLSNQSEVLFNTNPLINDTDGDSILDGTEVSNGLNPIVANLGDLDSDGISDVDEVNIHFTNPLSNDTDGDGLYDWDEVYVYFTNPAKIDTDEDGLSDWDEIYIYPTNATNSDTDSDGLNDWDEIFIYLTNATNSDTDADGLNDGDEILVYFTDVFNNDTDADGLTDGDEIHTYLTNATNSDTDSDGLNDWDEVYIYYTNPAKADTDSDGLNDWDELFIYLTNVTNSDTDADGLTDGDEILTYLTNATNPDTDVDGLTDGDEILTYLTNATNSDTDSDGLNDWDEIFVYLTNANKDDTDDDGMPDGWEVDYNFDPLDNGDRELDADGDGRTNYGEFLDGTDPTNFEVDIYQPTLFEIYNTTSPTEYDQILVEVHYYDGSGIHEVKIYYTIDGSPHIDSLTQLNSTCSYINLPLFPKGAVIEYYVNITDASPNFNYMTTDNYTITILDGDFVPPSISNVDQTPNNPAEIHFVNITCQVTDNDKGVGEVSLYWRVNGGGWFQNIMTKFGPIDYQSQIGTFAIFDFVEYYIEAVDNSDYNNTQIYPTSHNLNFTVVNSSEFDVDGPEILAFDYAPSSLIINHTLTINATITDISGIKNATIYYRFGDGPWFTEEMINTQASDYSVSIGPILNDSVLYFYLKAIDNSVYENEALKMYYGNTYFMMETIDLTLGEIFPESSELVGYEPFNIRVLDNDQNQNSFEKETIEIIITTTTDPIGKIFTLVETGINTGFFSASIPIAFIPDGISLEVNHGDIIHLMYYDPMNETGDPELVSRDIQWSMTTNAIILTNKTEYQTGDIVEITIFDNDINENVISIDNISVRVYSGLDFEGIFVVLYETGINTGIFVGTFEFNENLEMDQIDAIKVFGSCDVFIEYIDVYQNGILTIVHEVQFKSTNTDYSIYYTVLPEAPLNGDYLRLNAHLGNLINISLVQVRDENTGSLTNLTYIQLVDSHYIYAGWVLAESEGLLFQFHLEIVLFNGTVITTGSDQIPLLPTPMYVEWFPVEEEISGTVIILAKNRRGEVLSDVYFNISAKSPFMDQSIQLIYEESITGELIFSFGLDTELDVGRYLIEIIASKPGYFDGKTQLILVLVYGAEVFEGANIVEGDGIIYEINALQHCWLIMEAVQTPISTTMPLVEGYVPLDGSFISVYSMSKDDENYEAFTQITINLLIDETSIDINDLMVYFSTDSENWIPVSFINTINGEDETRWIQFTIPSEGVFGIVVPHDQLPHRNDDSTALANINYNLDNFNVLIELDSRRADPIANSEVDGQNSNLTQDLKYIVISIQLMAIFSIAIWFQKSKIEVKNAS